MKREISGVVAATALAVLAQTGGAAAQACSVNVGIVYPTSIDWGKPIAATALWVSYRLAVSSPALRFRPKPAAGTMDRAASLPP
jgi:hypothetical protein